jgi:glycosyltransferase involved in cell wall biosynthesis
MLYGLLRNLDAKLFTNEVICLTRRGVMAQQIEKLGIPVRILGMQKKLPNPLLLASLVRWIRKSTPNIVQTWMYHSDLLGGLCARLAGQAKIVWNVRHARLTASADKRTTLITASICARVSSWLPAKIICCSRDSRDAHIRLGYDASKFELILNGVDLERFKPDDTSCQKFRQELNLTSGTPLIGLIARFHPVKDHRNFIEAAGRLHMLRPEVNFVLCGEGVDWNNQDLVSDIKNAGIASCCHLLGIRENVPTVLASLDIATSASLSESFPNAVAEAMACGVPCVVTDVGASRVLVGNTGKVIPSQDSPAIAQAWCELLSAGREGRREFGAAARQRIENHFSLRACVKHYQDLYKSLARDSSNRLGLTN